MGELGHSQGIPDNQRNTGVHLTGSHITREATFEYSHHEQPLEQASRAYGDPGSKALSYSEVYQCPACGSGELSAIALMDVFACDFCRHMFTANLQTQSVQLADSLSPMAWQWQGTRWQVAHHRNTSAAVIWTFCSVLTVIPVGLIALANYIFPPLEGSNFPLMWITLTWVSHSAMSLWLLCEYHRWPWYVSSGIRLRRWREQWQESRV
ncbi:MAG: hypothetical protein AAFP03_03870 [Cyanobacteria bacterium J06598_3]